MPLDDATKLDINQTLAAVQEQLMASAPNPRGLVGAQGLQAVQILNRAVKMIENVLDKDPVAYVDFQAKIDAIWTAYVRVSNFAGLGGCAEALSRSV